MRSLALGLILALSTSAAFAEGMVDDMGAGLTMLESTAKAAFVEYGVEGDPMQLSLAQLAEIHALLVNKGQDNEVKAMLEAAIRKN
jgi:hypothetical protein